MKITTECKPGCRSHGLNEWTNATEIKIHVRTNGNLQLDFNNQTHQYLTCLYCGSPLTVVIKQEGGD